MAAYSKWTILKTARAADQIVTVSAYEKEKIGQCLNISPQRICVTHLAANPIFSAASTSMLEQWRVTLGRRLHLPDRFILGIGYEPRKNIELLVDLFAQLAPCYPELGLVIVVAEESRRSLLSQRVSDRGMADRAILLPAMSPKELLALYNLAEVFVYPSQRESFGLPPLEAIACGTPTIAMNLASLPEILEDGALLIDGQDSETWANAVTQVLANDEIRKALIDRGLRRASKFTWKHCAQTTLDVYRSVA
jgi:glycosyltransferase involved in cell wall biosynthesis